MAKIKDWVLGCDGNILIRQWHYMCPGCGHIHAVANKDDGTGHKFNGDYDRPTFTPSLLQDWAGVPRCHSHITNGMIQFGIDCSHQLAGATVELPDIEPDSPRKEVEI